MSVYKFLAAALVFFFLGTALLYTGLNRAPFRNAPDEHKHEHKHKAEIKTLLFDAV